MTARHWPLAAAALFMIAWGGNQFTPLLVMYRLGEIDPVVVDSLLFAYVLGIVPGLAVSGPLSDRIGRRPVMLPAPWIAIAGSLLLAAGGENPLVLAVGRILCGVALGTAMAVGGSWLKELSSAPFDPHSDGLAGARRQGMSLTLGFALGAAVAGALAQWGPHPHATPYLVHAVLTVPVALWLVRAPETRAPAPTGLHHEAERQGLGDVLRHPRFQWIVLPLAPWVFGASGVAYAIIPTLLTDSVRRAPIAFSGFLCLIALGAGFLIQNLARRIYSPGSIRLAQVSYGFLGVGTLLAVAVAATVGNPPVAIACGVLGAVVLGCGYGTALQACLLEVQRLASHHNLAALTAVFYALAYLGFAFPMVLAWLSSALSYPVMLGFGVVVLGVCLAALTGRFRAASR